MCQGFSSSGDNLLDLSNSSSRDHWVIIDDDQDLNPFLNNSVPAVAHVFDAPGATQIASSATYNIDFTDLYGQLVEQWDNVTIAPGATVEFLHFVTQQVTDEAAQVSAQRLLQMPPEALVGLTAADVSAVQNFPLPQNAVSTLTALPAVIGSVSGRVLAGDGVTPVPSAAVTVHSNNPYYGRTYPVTADGNGNFSLVSSLSNNAGTVAFAVDSFTLQATDSSTGVPLRTLFSVTAAW